MAERVGALVAVGRGVLGAAAADRIEHDEDRAGHGELYSSWPVMPAEARHRIIDSDDPSEPSWAERRGASLRDPPLFAGVPGQGAQGDSAHWLTTPDSVASLEKAAANRARV